MLISNYSVSRSQAARNLRSGIHNYTYYATDAKSLMKNAWIFGKVTKDYANEIGYFDHFHNSKGFYQGIHMHSFYGLPFGDKNYPERGFGGGGGMGER